MRSEDVAYLYFVPMSNQIIICHQDPEKVSNQILVGTGKEKGARQDCRWGITPGRGALEARPQVGELGVGQPSSKV